MGKISDPIIAGDMVELIDLILRQISGLDYNGFQQDRDKVDATAYRLQALGEYSTRLSETFKLKHDALPWQKMRGMRNILSHSYDYIDARLIWNVATTELAAVRAILTSEASKI
jgi:uncharacterized protein with HEPN domain